jgi:polyhydroxyalkanoate synthesis regulator phasin
MTEQKQINQMMDQMIDNSTKAFTSMFWFQEQGEKFMQVWMEQNKVGRDQAVKMAEKIAEQAKENQKLLQDMVQASVKLSLDTYKTASQNTLEQLQKQVDNLSKQVEQLKDKAGK